MGWGAATLLPCAPSRAAGCREIAAVSQHERCAGVGCFECGVFSADILILLIPSIVLETLLFEFEI
jgi:hypothetical protein